MGGTEGGAKNLSADLLTGVYNLPSTPPIIILKTMSTNVIETQPSVKTVQEFDVVLAKYAKQNPVKHAIKLASGEYEKIRKTLLGYVAPGPTPEEVEAKKAEEKAAKEAEKAAAKAAKEADKK